MKTYCSKCFFYHVSLNKRGLKEPSAGASHCILCSEQITADSKSPVAGCCYTCWESQETIAAAIQVEGTDGRMAVESVTAECKVAAGDLPAADQAAIGDEGQPSPPKGWSRQKRESEMVWNARIQSFLDGDNCKSQKHYIDLWKKASDEDKQAFRDMVSSKDAAASPSPACAGAATCDRDAGKPWQCFAGDTPTICLPRDYTLERLKADFAHTASSPGTHDQSRWEMYCLIQLLILSPESDLEHATHAEKALEDLHVNRKRLYTIQRNFSQPFPLQCPVGSKMGRTPSKSLSYSECKDLLLYIKFHERTGTALSIPQVEQAIVPWCFSVFC